MEEENPNFEPKLLSLNNDVNANLLNQYGQNQKEEIEFNPCVIPDCFPKCQNESHIFNFSIWGLDNPDYKYDINGYQSQFLNMIEAFLPIQQQFFTEEHPEYVCYQLSLLRHFILLCGNKKNPTDIYVKKKPKPLLLFSERFQVLDSFVKVLLNRLAMKVDAIRIEIVRILSRLSRTFPHFLNPENVKIFQDKTRSLMQKDEYIPEDQRTVLTQVLRHHTIILIAHVARQSVLWAENLYGHLVFLYNNSNPQINFESYYTEMKSVYPFTISIKHGDPYLYAIRKFTKVLSPAIKIEVNDIGGLLKLIFLYFYQRNYNIPVISTNLKILNDLIQANREGTLSQLQILNIMFLEFSHEIFPYLIENFQELVIIKSCIKLITSFYQNGEEYSQFLEDLNIEKIAETLLKDSPKEISSQWLKIRILSAKCIACIIDSTKQDGFARFEGIFPIVAEKAIQANQPYKLRIAFIKLFCQMIQYYPKTEICFNIEKSVESFVDNLDQDDDELIYESTNALAWLFLKLKNVQQTQNLIPSLTHTFFNAFFALNGQEVLKNVTNNENELVRNNALQFEQLIQQETQT